MLQLQKPLRQGVQYPQYLCQCGRCGDNFTVGVKEQDGRVVEVDEHPHIRHPGHGQKICHICGGLLSLYRF